MDTDPRLVWHNNKLLEFAKTSYGWARLMSLDAEVQQFTLAGLQRHKHSSTQVNASWFPLQYKVPPVSFPHNTKQHTGLIRLTYGKGART